MADFRKCLLAFALIALLAGVALADSPLQCSVGTSNTPAVRAEGLAELLGDVVLYCNNGTPTAAGLPISTATITVYTTVPLTSRIISGSVFSEALLLIDDPHTTAGNNPNNSPLLLCDASNNGGVCQVNGVSHAGVNGGVGQSGPYNGTGTGYNVFQGRVTGSNQVTFFGVPIDAPGTNGTRTIRITNLRGNANYLGVSSSLVPATIVANLSITPYTAVPLTNPQQTVAYVTKGLTVSTSNAQQSLVQCKPVNGGLTTGGSADASGGVFNVVFSEGFSSAWKEKNIATHIANVGVTAASGTVSYPADASQDVPGSTYYSETGFLANGTAPTSVPAGYGPYFDIGNAQTFSASAATAGLATQGTRLIVSFASVPSGTSLFVPGKVNLTVPVLGSSAAPSGVAVLVSTDANGAGTTSASAVGATTTALTQVTIANGAGVAVYEIVEANPTQQEQLSVPVTIAYASNVGSNLPAPGIQATVSGNFAPLSTVVTAATDAQAPTPRFAASNTPANSFKISKCSCNILFPWAVYTQGYDTGIAISNTSSDPFTGTAAQSGLVTINYYTSGTAPSPQTTTSVIPGGSSLVFTLSGGGTNGISGISSGFAGYIIAQAQFQYCHAYAYISSFGALPTSPGTSEGYLGIVLDTPSTPSRTGQTGEVAAH